MFFEPTSASGVRPSPMAWTRRPSSITASALVAVIALATVLTPTPPGAEAGIYQIVHPVHPDHLDRVYWSDTWGAPRSGGRSHIGVDIMGPKMVPLVAANDSVVTWGEFDNAGGNIIRLRDRNGWEYQYIHINNDTPGTDDGRASCTQAFAPKVCNNLDGHRIRRGLEFKAGELIGYIGDSGNAEWTGSHLHFEVYQPTPSGATPVNPTPFVDAAAANPWAGVPDTPLPVGSPWPDVATAVDDIFAAVEGRQPSFGEAQALADRLENDGVAATMAHVMSKNSAAAMIDRLYLIFFGRNPDDQGYDYWINERGDGQALEDIAEWFAESREYRQRYEGKTFEQFLDRLYSEVLERDPDAKGKAYWLEQLRNGEVNRGTIVVYFSEGEEARSLAQLRTERTVLARMINGTRPTEAELGRWVELRQSKSLTQAIETVLGS